MVRIYVEDSAFEGVKRIAEKSAEDFKSVYKKRPEIVSDLKKIKDGGIVYCTIGASSFLDELKDEDIEKLKGKRECYVIKRVDKLLVVAGSDKRGTIYGIFDLSEQIGVSPLVYWGDANPMPRNAFNIGDIEERISKEPSVKYRGFFINDEWPCFGNWTFEHFGGFTAEMYDHVFELVLRLKGNCLWPAMWSSSFALDGPGSLNEELADCYGVIINYSHHEPCLRASEEWDIYKGEGSPYGTEWNYSTNKAGLLKYWEDGLKRSGGYENIVTMGMRGERDSKMLGVNTLADSINFWKEIIINQNELIKKYADTKEYTHPRLVAIYKEVEDYFFGDDMTPGLEKMDILDDMLLMFCEDNFGFMRRLPQGKLREHRGGLGMYYHFDYHGDPISYEWINSTQLSKVWEQMTTAYEHGIREMWMVNVGDLKGNEIPLSYFMNLAYDYERWGVSNLESTSEYLEAFAKQSFNCSSVAELYKKAIDLISYRKPEALSPYTYAIEMNEADKILEATRAVVNQVFEIKEGLEEFARDGFYSMVEYPVLAGMNHIQMHIFSLKNEHFAKQGKRVANRYRDLVAFTYDNEKEIIKGFKEFKGGKWSGMELASHTGFTKWNEDGARKPLRYTVEPLSKAHMLVSRTDASYVAAKNYGSFDKIIVDDFKYNNVASVKIEVANDGEGKINCQIKNECPFIKTDWKQMEIEEQELLCITIDREAMTESVMTESFFVTDGDTTVEVLVTAARNPAFSKFGVSLLAEDYSYLINSENFKYELIPDYGKYGQGLKCFPVNKWPIEKHQPTAGYIFDFEKDCRGSLELCIAPTSPLGDKRTLRIGVMLNGNNLGEVDTITKDYKAGNCISKEWALGVLNQERRIKLSVDIKEGTNVLEIYAVDPGVVLEKIMIYEGEIPNTYFGF